MLLKYLTVNDREVTISAHKWRITEKCWPVTVWYRKWCAAIPDLIVKSTIITWQNTWTHLSHSTLRQVQEADWCMKPWLVCQTGSLWLSRKSKRRSQIFQTHPMLKMIGYWWLWLGRTTWECHLTVTPLTFTSTPALPCLTTGLSWKTASSTSPLQKSKSP